MKDEEKSPEQLSAELAALRRRCADLEVRYGEHQQLLRALRESEERFRAIAESARDFMFTKDLERRYTYVNPAMERLFGRPASDLVGCRPQDLFDAESAAIITEVDDIAFGGRVANDERTLPVGGVPHVFHTVQAPMLDTNNNIMGISGVVRDVTDRKRAHEERRELEHLLFQSQKHESLGVLAGGIAHDFNNILMGVLGWADLALQDLPPNSPARESLIQIETSARRAAGLASQMLAYSGRGQLVIEPLHLDSLVREMTQLLKVAISKKATLRLLFADDLPVFQADATQIRQVVMNLITNASEAIAAGGGQDDTISITIDVVDCNEETLNRGNRAVRVGLDDPLQAGRYISLEVSDTGCGMDKKTREKIFDPFFTTKFTGRGLGLAGVLGIVRSHHGAIKVSSSPGAGSTFTVLFPIIDEPLANAATPLKTWRGHGTILLIDDEQTVCVVGEKMLRRLGFDVLTTSDGHDAIELFRNHSDHIVCVLLDLTMPHLDGRQIFLKIRRLRPEVKVILSSGFNESEAIRSFHEEGLAGFLQKPYDLTSLRQTLRTVLGE